MCDVPVRDKPLPVPSLETYLQSALLNGTHKQHCGQGYAKRASKMDMSRSIFLEVVSSVALSVLRASRLSRRTRQAAEPQPAQVVTDEEALKQGHDLTKRILLAIIEMERFSLNYRLTSMRSPKLVLIQYAANQEASAAGGFASAVISTQQSEIALRDFCNCKSTWGLCAMACARHYHYTLGWLEFSYCTGFEHGGCMPKS